VLLVLASSSLIDGNEGESNGSESTRLRDPGVGLNIVVGFAGLPTCYETFSPTGIYTYAFFSSYLRCKPNGGLMGTVPARSSWKHVHSARGPDRCISRFIVLADAPIAAIINAFFGGAVGAPTLRLKGRLLAIVTLAW